MTPMSLSTCLQYGVYAFVIVTNKSKKQLLSALEHFVYRAVHSHHLV